MNLTEAISDLFDLLLRAHDVEIVYDRGYPASDEGIVPHSIHFHDITDDEESVLQVLPPRPQHFFSLLPFRDLGFVISVELTGFPALQEVIGRHGQGNSPHIQGVLTVILRNEDQISEYLTNFEHRFRLPDATVKQLQGEELAILSDLDMALQWSEFIKERLECEGDEHAIDALLQAAAFIVTNLDEWDHDQMERLLTICRLAGGVGPLVTAFPDSFKRSRY